MSVGLSRRTFLAGGASLAGIGSASVLVPSAAAAVPALSPAGKLALRRSAFLPLVGQTFWIAHDRGSLNVVLHQVGDLEPSVRPGAEHQFSLMFIDARHRPALPQKTYAISHRRSRISLFVVPIGLRQTPQRYQAIVNNPPQAATR